LALLLCRHRGIIWPVLLRHWRHRGTSVEYIHLSAQAKSWVPILFGSKMYLLPGPACGSSTNPGWKADYIVGQVYRRVSPLVSGLMAGTTARDCNMSSGQTYQQEFYGCRTGEFGNVGGCSGRRVESPKRASELITEINRLLGDKEQRLEEKSRMRRSQQRHRPNPAYKTHLPRSCDLKKRTILLGGSGRSEVTPHRR
jgi:hypothetical protein